MNLLCSLPQADRQRAREKAVFPLPLRQGVPTGLHRGANGPVHRPLEPRPRAPVEPGAFPYASPRARGVNTARSVYWREKGCMRQLLQGGSLRDPGGGAGGGLEAQFNPPGTGSWGGVPGFPSPPLSDEGLPLPQSRSPPWWRWIWRRSSSRRTGRRLPETPGDRGS